MKLKAVVSILSLLALMSLNACGPGPSNPSGRGEGGPRPSVFPHGMAELTRVDANIISNYKSSEPPKTFQQADLQTLGACFFGQLGIENCIQETQQHCNDFDGLWSEGKCPGSVFPPPMFDAN